MDSAAGYGGWRAMLAALGSDRGRVRVCLRALRLFSSASELDFCFHTDPNGSYQRGNCTRVRFGLKKKDSFAAFANYS